MSTVLKFEAKQIKTSLVCSDCGAPGQGSCNCGAPYITPGERAEAAVKANPGKSDRAIADEIGVSAPTVGKARKKAATVNDFTVEKRTGKDGKARKQPARKSRAETTPKAIEREARVAKLMDAGKSIKEIAAELGMIERHVAQVVEHVRIAREAEANIVDRLSIDPTTLAPSAKAKLEIAKRMMERELNTQHVARMRELDEEVRQRVLNETKEYLAMLKAREEEADKTIATYREFTNNHEAVFTSDEFRTVLMCLHPDGQRTSEKLSNAFRLFNNKKFQLTGQK
jgi:DNA-binding CsgD family transcriptional regulator